MKLIIISLFLINPFASLSVLNDVREHFPNIESFKQANDYSIQLNKESNPESKAYNAAMYFMKSRYVKFPLAKYNYFKKGKKSLDLIIKENPTNIEIRYIRFLLQHEIPKFLGYNQSIEEDFNVIINYFTGSSLHSDYKIKMLKNMLLVKNLNELKKTKINLLINSM